MRFGITIARTTLAVAASAGFCLLLAGPARADGGGGGDSSNATCPRGEVYDARSMSCVKQGSGILPDKALAEYAYALAKAERYDEALDVLKLMKNPNTPQALNYRGYATRKLGRVDEGISYYLKSVKLDPRYAQVREYLGEAYVIQGKFDLAKSQLATIRTICGTGCEEYEDLAQAIEDSKL